MERFRGLEIVLLTFLKVKRGQFLKGVREPGGNMEKLTKIYFVTLKNYLKEIGKLDNG